MEFGARKIRRVSECIIMALGQETAGFLAPPCGGFPQEGRAAVSQKASAFCLAPDLFRAYLSVERSPHSRSPLFLICSLLVPVSRWDGRDFINHNLGNRPPFFFIYTRISIYARDCEKLDILAFASSFQKDQCLKAEILFPPKKNKTLCCCSCPRSYVSILFNMYAESYNLYYTM